MIKPNTTYIIGELFTTDKYSGIIFAIENNFLYIKCTDGLVRCYETEKGENI